jgi:histidyl-tRNA synthetase
MILEHEIPKGSRLYFGKVAKKKRELENIIGALLDQYGFEEIVTPNFSYSQHQSIENCQKLITFSDENNTQVALRADSTLDVVRIITKRLGRTTSHKKWFYIQPIFSYGSKEDYQIGCEWIDHNNIVDILNLTAQILKALEIKPVFQLSNINIPKLICKELQLDIELFKNGEIAKLFELNNEWLNALIQIQTIEDLKAAIAIAPSSLCVQLEKLLKTAQEIEYDNLVIAPLYHGSLKYYDDVYYRVIHDNHTVCKGGHYSSEGISSLGFAFYTDSLLKILED